MSPRTGRPPKENPRNVNLNIRITKEESERIQNCAEKLNMTRTDTIMKGIEMVEKEVKEQK
ncbi:MAG: CopG family transcriptional regulator [Lachnospiraceae bacterium]|nr:CopG family transcriptional regulator [Lachnospiraceae bacterium]